MFRSIRAWFKLQILVEAGVVEKSGRQGETTPNHLASYSQPVGDPDLRIDKLADKAYLELACSMMSADWPEIPVDLERLAHHYTLVDTIPSNPSRTLGIYKSNSASAILDADPNHPGFLTIQIEATTIDDLLGLYSRIRIGSIHVSTSWSDEVTPR